MTVPASADLRVQCWIAGFPGDRSHRSLPQTGPDEPPHPGRDPVGRLRLVPRGALVVMDQRASA